MQEVIASFSAIMTWLVLGLAGVAVVLLIVSVWHLPSHQTRALVGAGGMVLVLVGTVAGVSLLTGDTPRSGTPLQLLLPLLGVLLITCLYALTFPPLLPSHPALAPWRLLSLLLLTGLAALSTAGLVLLDLLAP